jgi:RNA polymerase sigma factor (TIGR02999 family)
MSSLDDKDAKQLLDAWRAGDTLARDQLFDRLYAQLRKISATLLRGEGDISLTTGDLVNEAVMRVIKTDTIEINDKAHFLALSARTMRRVLIDHARKHASGKRQHQKVTLVTRHMDMQDSVDIHLLENALLRLKVMNPDRAKIVEMRYYGGLSLEEIAQVMNCSASTVKRDWRVSRAWLLETLEELRLEDG